MLPDESRKVRAFRIGLMRRVGSSVVFKPAALIGLSADGGVFVSPSQGSDAWQYGVMEGVIPVTTASAETRLKPKLHYHRSGLVYATLSGHDLERRSLQLAPLPTLRRSQIFSVMCVRTWELPSRPKAMEWGDSATAVKRWPDVAMWGVFLLETSEDDRRALLIPGMRGHGMLAGQDYTHGVVSLSAYGREAVLLLSVQIEDTWNGLPTNGGTTIAALPWHPGSPGADDRTFGLWTAGLRNPLVHWDALAPDDLTPTSTTSEKKLDEDIDRMADFTVPEGGFDLRPPARPGNDFSGTPFARPETGQVPPLEF